MTQPLRTPNAPVFAILLPLCLAVTVGTSAVHAQAAPAVLIRNDSIPLIDSVLRARAEAAGLTFQSASKRTLRFSRNAGPMSVRGQMVPVVLEITFHLENAKPGTRIVPTEELIATLNQGIEERRRPNPKERTRFYLDLLEGTKADVEQILVEFD